MSRKSNENKKDLLKSKLPLQNVANYHNQARSENISYGWKEIKNFDKHF